MLAIRNGSPEVNGDDDQCNSLLFIQFHFFSSGPRHRSGRVVCVLRLIEPQNALILISFPKCIAQNDRTKVLNYSIKFLKNIKTLFMKAFQFIDEIDKSHLLVNGDEGQGIILN